MIVLVALLVCLIPTTIGALLSAIGIAGMDRLVQRNVLAMSGRAVEAAGDVNTLLLDKTGTITLGNRQAAEFLPAGRRRTPTELADAAQLASLADETPEGRSIVVLAKRGYGLRDRTPGELDARDVRAVHRPDPDERRRPRRGRHARASARARPSAVRRRGSARHGGTPPATSARWSTASPRGGGTPLVVAELGRGRRAGPRRRPPQGHREARACASGSTSCAGWASGR